MPQAQHGPITIDYAEQGAGPPLVLVYGIGGSRVQWRQEFLDALAADFRVITFDNRGTGGSSKPAEPWTMADFAADTLALFDHLGLRAAHLLGLSMGGMIAQEVALTAPRRIERLVLADTHPGSKAAVPSPPWVREAFGVDPTLSPEEQARKTRPTVYSERFLAEHSDWLDRRMQETLAQRTSPEMWGRHSAAIQGWDAFDRLPRIKIPTLVLHGAEDVLVLPENGKTIAAAIPGARLEIVPGCGHIPMTEQPGPTAALIRDFLLATD